MMIALRLATMILVVSLVALFQVANIWSKPVFDTEVVVSFDSFLNSYAAITRDGHVFRDSRPSRQEFLDIGREHIAMFVSRKQIDSGYVAVVGDSEVSVLLIKDNKIIRLTRTLRGVQDGRRVISETAYGSLY